MWEMKTEMVYSHDLFFFCLLLKPPWGWHFHGLGEAVAQKGLFTHILPKNLAGALNEGTTFLLYLILQILVQGSFVTA